MFASLITVQGVRGCISERLLEMREGVDCAAGDNPEDAGDREGVSNPCAEVALPFGTGVTGVIEPKRLLVFGEPERLLGLVDPKRLLVFGEAKRLLACVKLKVLLGAWEGAYLPKLTLSSSESLSSSLSGGTRELDGASGQGAIFAFSSLSSIA